MADAAGARFGVAILANSGADPVTIFRTNLRALEDALEASGFVWRGQGLLAARPAAGVQGGIYKATDAASGVLYYDNGTTWETVGASSSVDDSAAVGSLRTLGAGALQAAAGNHTHGEDATILTLMGAL